MKRDETMKSILKKIMGYKKTTIFIIILLILLRIFFEYAKESKGLYLVHGYMYNIINYIILSSALLICFENKKI